jgi:hypothetical protein
MNDRLPTKGDMDLYVGTKRVAAVPMTRGEYHAYRGFAPPVGAYEATGDEGFLVEYLDSPDRNHLQHEHYITWSPAGVFNAAYARSGQMNMGHALELLHVGFAMSRSGWNGKGMFIYLVGRGRYPPATGVGHAIAACQRDGLVPYLPYIAMCTVSGDVVPWLCSQTDMLATDWGFGLVPAVNLEGPAESALAAAAD